MSDQDRWLEVLLEIHRGLPRQGPGLDACTLRALSTCRDLPSDPRVLDLGCGPGMQTLALAGALPDAHVTAVDMLQVFLDELGERAAAAGVSDRVERLQGDMADLPFPDGSFDLLWSEAAAYSMGFEAALRSWHRLLREGGWLVVSELVWLERDPPEEVAQFFAGEYPAMAHVEDVAARFVACGYRLIERFALPDEAWWAHYYEPLEARLPGLRERFAEDPEALSIVESSAREIAMRRRFGDRYGYEFFIAKRT